MENENKVGTKKTADRYLFFFEIKHKTNTTPMPPKTRISRLTERQSHKRKADEVELSSEDLSNKEEDRPKKKAKIEPEKKSRNYKANDIDQTEKNEPVLQSNNNKNISELIFADQDSGNVGRPSRRAKKVAASKIMKNTPTEDPDELAWRQKALLRLTTLKEQHQAPPRIEDEEYTLPDELILQIFSYLKRRDLYSIGATCRQWHRLSNDHSLGWHLALSIPLIDSLDVYKHYEGKTSPVRT